MTGHRARPVRVAAGLWRSHWWVAAIYWGATYLLFGIIGLIVATTAGLEHSVWIGACWWSQYFLMAAGISVTAQYLRVHIAGGVTRRVFGLGVVLFGLTGSILFGAATVLGFVVERGLATSAGAAAFPTAADYTATVADVLVATLDFSILHAAHFFAGWAIAATFQRFGVVAGLAVIVPAMTPGLLMDLVTIGSQPTAEILEDLDLAVLTRPSLVAVVVTLTAAVTLLAYRSTRAAAVNGP